MKIWKVSCWSCKNNYNVYVEAENVEQAKRKASDCIDLYNKTSDVLDFVYYRTTPVTTPELAILFPEGTGLNTLIPFKRFRSPETFEDWLNS